MNPGVRDRIASGQFSSCLLYTSDPAGIKAPTAIVRGEWDSLVTDADARWLFDALNAAPTKRDLKIGRGTHLMHLEENRYELYKEAQSFLDGRDRPAD